MSSSPLTTESAASLAAHFDTSRGPIPTIRVTLTIHDLCVFEPVFRVNVVDPVPGQSIFAFDTHQAGLYWNWLPRGEYRFDLRVSAPHGARIDLSWGTTKLTLPPAVSLASGGPQAAGSHAADAQPAPSVRYTIVPDDDTRSRLAAMPWAQGLTNWWHRHFDHAANVIADEMLKGDPSLRGRILDVGAGDGITDLGLYLRYQPEELVGVDIVDLFTQLPDVARRHGIPLAAMPERMKFLQQSAEALPHPDGYFDLVLSWGSVEHVVGGYRKVLDEVWRVLKPGGVFFVNPGLYYSGFGSHIGEVFADPHHHLKLSEDALKEGVLTSKIDWMDRGGFDYTNADLWRFYTELNRIRVGEFERELKEYGYAFVFASLRTSPVTYDGEGRLQRYSVLDLAIDDAFFVLRKPRSS